MSAIGPDIPAHILASVGCTKPDVSSGSDSEDEGPGPAPAPISIPAAAPAVPSIGPQAPTSVLDSTPTLVQIAGDDSDDDYTPALPPGIILGASAPSVSASAAARAYPTVSSRKPVGPSLPRHLAQANDDDSDEDVGPQPLHVGPSSSNKDAVSEFREREERRRKAAEEALKPKKLERDEWMLKPPSASDLLQNIDTTKIIRGGKRFNASKKAPTKDSAGTSTLWTETPAERQQRLADEMTGKRRRQENSEAETTHGEDLERAKRRKAEDEVRRGVEEHTRSRRGGALVDQHASTLGGTEPDKDAGPAAIWEHGRDMALSGRLMDDSQRERIIKDSRGLSDRFGAGKGGSFL